MSWCHQCGVTVTDGSDVCPLCQCVLEPDNESEYKYPDIGAKNQVLKLITRIYLFLSIVIEFGLIVYNYINYEGVAWCAIPGCALAYGYLTLAYTINYSRAGYRAKIVVGVFGAIGVLLVIDHVLGNYGWATDYVFPALLLATDATCLILMIVNRRNWQSYLTFQIWMIVFSALPLLVSGLIGVLNPIVFYIALFVSIACFLGTWIIGGPKATDELKRRFHI